MLVNAISSNYYNTQYVKRGNTSCKGKVKLGKGLDDIQTDRILEMLKSKSKGICFCPHVEGLIPIANILARMYQNSYIGNVGMFIIPDGKLADFVEPEITIAAKLLREKSPDSAKKLGIMDSEPDLKNFKGINIAYGNIGADPEKWSDIQGSITALIPKTEYGIAQRPEFIISNTSLNKKNLPS